MPEPLLIASAASAIVVNSIKICLSVHGAIDEMKQAPKHLKAVSSDLKAFFHTLATIQHVLNDDELAQSLLYREASANLQTILSNCVTLLQEFEHVVNGYIKVGRASKATLWQKVSWTWKAKDVESLQRRLSEHKDSLSLAISLAHMINHTQQQATSSRIATEFRQRLEIHCADVQEKLVAIQASNSRMDEDHRNDNVAVQTQRKTIRAFTRYAETVLSSSASSAGSDIQLPTPRSRPVDRRRSPRRYTEMASGESSASPVGVREWGTSMSDDQLAMPENDTPAPVTLDGSLFAGVEVASGSDHTYDDGYLQVTPAEQPANSEYFSRWLGNVQHHSSDTMIPSLEDWHGSQQDASTQTIVPRPPKFPTRDATSLDALSATHRRTAEAIRIAAQPTRDATSLDALSATHRRTAEAIRRMAAQQERLLP